MTRSTRARGRHASSNVQIVENRRHFGQLHRPGGRMGRDGRAVAPPRPGVDPHCPPAFRSEEHTSELQSHSNISYAVFCLKKKKKKKKYTSLSIKHKKKKNKK